jgi:hypothetical protein
MRPYDKTETGNGILRRRSHKNKIEKERAGRRNSFLSLVESLCNVVVIDNLPPFVDVFSSVVQVVQIVRRDD